MGEQKNESQKAIEARALEEMHFWLRWVMRKALAEHETAVAEHSVAADQLRRAMQ